MLKGRSSLAYHYQGGRRPKLSLSQQKTLTDLLDAGPEASGFKEGGWHSGLVQQLIKLTFGVEYHVQYVSALLPKWGYSFQKAERVSDYLDPLRRQEWREET
jgi:putative transposase